MSTEIYILIHKPLEYEMDLSRYIPIHVGAALTDKKFAVIRDNIRDNISWKNPCYLETTGIYWIWKNSTADIKGQMQYRRFLSVNPDFCERILKNYDIITANPSELKMTVETQYEISHDIDDLLAVKDILMAKYPEYVDSYNEYISQGNILYYSNSFVTTKERYNDLCSFCFDVLDTLCAIKNYDDYQVRIEHAKETMKKHPEHKLNYSPSHPDLSGVEYQTRICGYLFERLFTLYVLHNKLNVYKCGEYIKLEDNMVD